MKAKHTIQITFFALLLTLAPLKPLFAADLQAPQQAIETASAQLQSQMQDKSFTKDFAKINDFVNQVIYPRVDFDRIAALVLGKLWKTATVDERNRFKQEFQVLLVRTYSRAFVEFKEWSVRFLPLEMAPGDTKVIVKTEVLQPGVQPIAIDYRMALHEGEWKAYDIMIEGVSLVTNYRTTFNNEMQTKGSLSAVIDSLAKRNTEALAAAPGKKS
ncbi:MlaC/ttg2D family ABC transporter substrate-binding protein [Methylovulum psychrotolerans]|uniref:Toluene tolerance protein n=1 Tax=Methylovulum psychrotolerans TaxID=1704499 RepID=A0A1Z4C185_9GAMM|nr:ABC transporter substrate-binding protein [Methylovulum psychrotolerans]ASF47298.1 toluene tolerance protein [Methylovulum psychrotolerans]MBT9100082.1 ABC transporter substrate-binding protein [Methylovulum psychrotolerans]POZ50395.1 toluene tolerance protein [Methylovulum psychrotolerans]